MKTKALKMSVADLMQQAESEVLKRAEEMERRTGLDWLLCCYLASKFVERNPVYKSLIHSGV